MKPVAARDILVLGDPKIETEKLVAARLEKMISGGFIDRKTIERAEDEARTWFEDNRAFYFWIHVYAGGRA